MLAIALRIIGRVAVLGVSLIIGDIERDITDRESGHPASLQAAPELAGETIPDRDSPDHLNASVLVNGCSGTVISKGDRWACILSARHCVQGNIGGQAPVVFIDGTTSTATLLAIDDGRDLARFAVPSAAVLGVAHVQLGTPDKARYECIGWPAKSGAQRAPYYYLLKPLPPPGNHSWNTACWAFKVDNGGAIPGVSGSGIFANGQLCSVLSRNNGHNVATECYGSNPVQIADFLRETDKNGCSKWAMGEWGEKALNFADAPAAVADASASNKPIFECSNGRCLLIRNKPAPVPDPPPDAGHDDQPPKRNRIERIADRISGKSKIPDEFKGNCDQAEKLMEHEDRISALEKRQPEKGEQGPPGRDGKDFTPPLPAVKPVHKFPHALLAFCASFGCVVVFGAAHRFNLGFGQKGK